jgi:hypothetical protein
MRTTRRLLTTMFLWLAASSVLSAQSYAVVETGTFAPQNKTVLLLRNAEGQRPIILFQTSLRVNTDGSPLSYHPQDPRGREKALNNICNAIVVRTAGTKDNLCRSNFGQAISVFEKFRDSNYRTVPRGFEITWANVLASTVRDKKVSVPCVFSSGQFKGYFGSLTALKNGVAGDKGECDIDDQVNPIAVPALVLVGGENIVKQFGAGVGDLLVAFNPATQRTVAAIIGDTGPDENLGEGSVLLNMKLLGTTTPPTNRAETFKLTIENTQVLVAIVPGSRSFQTVKPYTADNIDRRVRAWEEEAGFDAPEDFLNAMKSFEGSLTRP